MPLAEPEREPRGPAAPRHPPDRLLQQEDRLPRRSAHERGEGAIVFHEGLRGRRVHGDSPPLDPRARDAAARRARHAGRAAASRWRSSSSSGCARASSTSAHRPGAASTVGGRDIERETLPAGINAAGAAAGPGPRHGRGPPRLHGRARGVVREPPRARGGGARGAGAARGAGGRRALGPRRRAAAACAPAFEPVPTTPRATAPTRVRCPAAAGRRRQGQGRAERPARGRAVAGGRAAGRARADRRRRPAAPRRATRPTAPAGRSTRAGRAHHPARGRRGGRAPRAGRALHARPATRSWRRRTPTRRSRRPRRLAQGGRSFLLVTDLGMPTSGGSSFQGGFEVVKRLGKMNLRPPVLLMTESLTGAAGPRPADGDPELRVQARPLKLDPRAVRGRPAAFAAKILTDVLPAPAPRRRRRGPRRPRARRAAEAGSPARAAPRLARARPGPFRVPASGGSRSCAGRSDATQIAALVMKVAREFFERGVLFLVKNDEVRGLGGFGAGPERRDAQPAGARGGDPARRAVGLPRRGRRAAGRSPGRCPTSSGAST